MSKKRRKKKRMSTGRKVVFSLLIVVQIVILSVIGFLYYQQTLKKSVPSDIEQSVMVEEEKDGAKKILLNPDWDYLLANYPNMVGWIYVPDTSINYPIMQGKDNEYYLNRSIEGWQSDYGAIFLDSEANSDFSSENSIIYGHSVEWDGGMFTDIAKYKDYDWFTSHDHFYLLTPKGNYKVNNFVFANTVSKSVYYYPSIGTGYAREDTLSKMIDQSTYHTDIEVGNNNIITLATCDVAYGLDSDKRLILSGVPEEYNEDIYYTVK